MAERWLILYCACGAFIPWDVQALQSGDKKQCIRCCIKAAIADKSPTDNAERQQRIQELD